MRADRLVATVLLLQTRGRMTAADLAHELEVSVATSRRDLVALSSAGVPVYPQRGRGGGWSLVGGGRTDLSGLTSTEANALFLALGPVADSAVVSAARKLLRALPTTFREDAERAGEAVLVDPVPWSGTAAAIPDLHRPLQEAVVARLRIELSYVDRTGQGTRRSVDPYGLVDKDGLWYLLAGTRTGIRTFRLDRITDAVITDTHFELPEDVTVTEAWARVVADVERQRSSTTALIELPTRHLWVLRRQFGRHCLVEATDGDRVRLRVAASTALEIAQQLAGWGDTVTVIEPEDVRVRLARIGAELVCAYHRPAADRGMPRVADQSR